MPAKLATTVSKIASIPNAANAALLTEFHRYLKEKGSSEAHQNNCLKTATAFAIFLGPKTSFYDINKQTVLSFLDTKVKSAEVDPEKRWITTWNHYLRRIKLFGRWLWNARLKEGTKIADAPEYWETPTFLKIKEKRSKRLSPYSETDIWERDELLTIVKYETHQRNKAALTLFWDLDARNHEVTLLRIKNIRFKERYAEGEIPHEAKTGSGPILLTCSFPYVRDWLNKHPFKDNPEARVICNLYTGAPIGPEAMWTMMKQLRRKIIKLVESDLITDAEEREKLLHLLRTKKWNPYCLRHSAITADSDYLPEYALKKKVRWSMNSKQGSRYIKNRMGSNLKRQILAQAGITSDDKALEIKPAVLNCHRCLHVNAVENKYCSKCSYPLTFEAYESAKGGEAKIESVEQRMKGLESLLLKMQLALKNIKPELLASLEIVDKDPIGA